MLLIFSTLALDVFSLCGAGELSDDVVRSFFARVVFSGTYELHLSLFAVESLYMVVERWV